MERPAQNWAQEAIGSALDEARLYLATAAAFVRHPGTFSAEWAVGERRAMNPLGFFATSLAVIGALGQLDRLWPAPGAGAPSFVGDALEALGPYLHAVILALLVHAMLRARRSGHPVLDSVAAALYAAGVAQVAAALVVALIQVGFRKPIPEVGQSPVGVACLAVAVIGAALFFAVALVQSLAALHGMPRRWPAVALTLSWVLTGAILSLLQPPGRYGLHPLFTIRGTTVTVGLGF